MVLLVPGSFVWAGDSAPEKASQVVATTGPTKDVQGKTCGTPGTTYEVAFPDKTIVRSQTCEKDKSAGGWITQLVGDLRVIGLALLNEPEAIQNVGKVWLRWELPVEWIVGTGLAFVLLHYWISLLRLIAKPLSRLLFRTWLRPPNKRLPDRDAPRLLADQETAIDRLIEEAQRLGPGRPGRMAGLKGDWGAGKTYVVEALLNAVNACNDNKLVALRINIWEEEREHDLHLSVVRNFLGQRALFDRFGDDYPWRLLFAPFLNVLGRLLPNGLEVAFGGSGASLKAGISVPMLWQQSFLVVIDKAVQDGWKFIVIFDEIDRADPPLAQAAITLARRALDVPGVLVVLPYVEEQIRYKVFNPATVVTPDLVGTLEAILDGEAGKLDARERALWRKFAAAAQPSVGEDEPAGEKDKKACDKTPAKRNVASFEKMREARRQFLLALYFDRTVGHPARRDGLFRRFSEKYLSWSLKLEGARGENLATFVLDCETVFRNVWRRAMRGDEGVMRGAISNMAREGIPTGVISLPPRFRISSLRSFEGVLDELLEEAKDDLARLADTDILQARLAAIVAFACAMAADANRD
jgi:hypothetical protein